MKTLLFLLLVLSGTAQASPISVEMLPMEDTEILLGKPVSLTFEVTYPSSIKVHFPDKPYLERPLRLVNQERTQIPGNNGTILETQILTLVSFRTGTQVIPAFDIPYVIGDETGTVQTKEVRFRVASRLSNSLNPTLKMPPAPLPIYHRNWPLLWALFAIGAIVLSVLGTLVALRVFGRAMEAAEALPPARPAHEIAFERLEALRNDTWREQEDIQGFYFELTEIIRQYLDNRYHTGATAETTTELLEQMTQLAPIGLPIDVLRTLLSQSDLVKFARSGASLEQAETAITQVSDLVEATRLADGEEEELEEDAPYVLEDAPYPLRLAAGAFEIGLAGLLTASVHLLTRDLLIWSAQAALAGGLLWFLVLTKDVLARGPGNRLMGLVLRQETGEMLSPRQQIRRNAIVAIPIMGWTIALVWSLLDPSKRRPGDRVTLSSAISVENQSLSPALVGGLGVLVGLASTLFVLYDLSIRLGGTAG